MSRSGRATESAAELRRMYSEIAKGDPERARTAAKEHVRSAASAARQVFADQSIGPKGLNAFLPEAMINMP